jgi:hypothetical protein
MFKTKSEREFSLLFDAYRIASTKEDIFKHFDIVVNKGVKVDVKGMKRENRSDKTKSANIHWIEFLNVHGNDGWIKGEADYIAFEHYDLFIIVNREKLFTFCKEKVTDMKHYKTKEIYKLYRRDNKRDLITMIKTETLIALSDRILKKSDRNVLLDKPKIYV